MPALIAVAVAPLVIGLYAYIGYPLILLIWTNARRRPIESVPVGPWPFVTITLPVYNAAPTVRATLESVLALDYPQGLVQLLVISDGSTDGTDEIAVAMATRGVELLRLPRRQGKTAAENAAMAIARGDIIVNIDATVFVPPGSLKALVRVFDDPTIGVASGQDVSVGATGSNSTASESGYVGYEMWVRGLETTVGSIVGASGCFFGVRNCIHASPLAPDLSWDFASALVARQMGDRSVSVPDAICIVPRTAGIRMEFRRKARTMARGLNTLFAHRSLMNPVRYGVFALMLISHKLLRWVPYLLAPVGILALGLLARQNGVARISLAVSLIGLGIGIIGVRSRRAEPLRPVALAAFVVASLTAGLLAWVNAFRRTEVAMWNPTVRPEVRGQ